MMKAILNKCLEYEVFTISTICDLHKPCIDDKRCNSCSSVKLVDFDKVKEWFCSLTESRSLNSVDALLLDSGMACFIEIKGWKDYIKWQNPSIESIAEQASRYSLENKYVDSYHILRSMVNMDKFFCFNVHHRQAFYKAKKIFIMVTDVNEDAGIDYIQTCLDFLSSSSSVSVERECYNASKERLNRFDVSSMDMSNPIINKLIYCKNFDREMCKLMKKYAN